MRFPGTVPQGETLNAVAELPELLSRQRASAASIAAPALSPYGVLTFIL